MKKVLILGVASVQADALKVLKALGYETFACAKALDGPGAAVADHFEVIDILDCETLTRFIEKNAIDAVYSVGSDIAMPIACDISERLGLPHFVSSETAKKCNDKVAMRTTLGRCQGNIPFQVLEDRCQLPQLDMPFIMKPADSQGQRGIFLIRSLQEFKDSFDKVKSFSRSGQVIVEKFIDGPELSVNVYLVDGRVEFLIASDRQTWPQYTGLIHKHIVPTTKIDSKTLHSLETIVMEACKRQEILNGPAYFQVKVQNGQPYIIEMTPRLDGCHMWKLLRYHTGIDLMKLTVQHLLEQNISELRKDGIEQFPYELEFFCQVPGTVMDQGSFMVPQYALEYDYYYESGDRVRPVNGRFEKVGYFIAPAGRGAK